MFTNLAILGAPHCIFHSEIIVNKILMNSQLEQQKNMFRLHQFCCWKPWFSPAFPIRVSLRASAQLFELKAPRTEDPQTSQRSVNDLRIIHFPIWCWYIYLQNWVILFGQMLVNIPAPWGDFLRANVGKQIQHHGAYGFWSNHWSLATSIRCRLPGAKKLTPSQQLLENTIHVFRNGLVWGTILNGNQRFSHEIWRLPVSIFPQPQRDINLGQFQRIIMVSSPTEVQLKDHHMWLIKKNTTFHPLQKVHQSILSGISQESGCNWDRNPKQGFFILNPVAVVDVWKRTWRRQTIQKQTAVSRGQGKLNPT